MKKLIIGLTGLIGSGKSAVSQILNDDYNAEIIDTDIIARECMQIPQIISDCHNIFGDNMFNHDKTINREFIRDIIFTNNEKLAEFEKIIHPQILLKTIQQIANSTKKLIIIVVPLLFKAPDYLKIIDRSLVVDCNDQTRIKRLKLRSNMTDEIIESINKTQMPRNEQLNLADDVINNDKDIKHLKNQIENLYSKYQHIINETD